MSLLQKGPTLLLKLLISFAGVSVLLVALLGLQVVLRSENEEFRPIFLTMYVATVPFFFAVSQTIKLLNYVDRNKAFSEQSVDTLKNIKYSSITFAALFVLVSPYQYFVAQLHDAPGIMAFGMIFIFGSTVVAAIAHVLQTLIQNATELKSEHELTV